MICNIPPPYVFCYFIAIIFKRINIDDLIRDISIEINQACYEQSDYEPTELDNKELFLETLDEINTVARTAKQEKEEKFIATVACKAAVKANMVLTKEEVESLMDQLLKLPNPFTCPHGRPTAIKMSKYEIERKFARK